VKIIAPLKSLLRAEPSALAGELERPKLLPYLLAIVIGCGSYGVALGLWRAPLMGLYVGIKMPLLILLTLSVNGLINGMMAQVLGSGLAFRQTLTAILMSFATFGMIVGSLSPLVIGMVLDAPPLNDPNAWDWYRMFLLMNTAVIAFAGVVANHKLLRLIQHFAGSASIGWRTLIAWLAGNLFVGAQLSYLLRPFFGNPELPVQFLRDDPFHGNFYQAVWGMIAPAKDSIIAVTVTVAILLTPVVGIIVLMRLVSPKPKP
jgi:hypothetical protein